MDTQTQEAPRVVTSILSDLRQARKKIGAGADPLDIPIPGYDEKLIARFRWVPLERLASTAKSLAKIDSPTRQQVAAAADALVATCDEIMVRVNDEVVPLSTNDFPITFSDGERLSYALGFEKPETARECVQLAFSNDYALIDTAFKLMTWLEDTSRKVSEEQLGE